MSIKDLQNKKNPYQVPPGYFENLPEVIAKKATKKAQKSNIFAANWFKYSSSVAAVLVLAIVFLFLQQEQKNEVLDFTHFSEQEITNYLLNHENISESEILHFLDEQQTKNQEEISLFDEELSKIPLDAIEEEILLDDTQILF